MTPFWYALNIRSGYDIARKMHKELSVAQDLRAQGHTVFVPVETVLHHARSSKGTTVREKEQPIVRSYVFCDQPWHGHKDVRGCILVRGVPYRIPNVQMQPLFRQSGRSRMEGDVVAALTIGQVVKLDGTAYHGMPVTIAKLDANGKRVTVEVDVFGGKRLTVVDREMIAA